MAEVRDFIARQNSHWLGNAVAGGIVNFTSGAGVNLATNVFGGFGISDAVSGNQATITWLNDVNVVPVIAHAAIVDTTAITAFVNATAARFIRVGGVASNSAVVGHFGAAITEEGTAHIVVLGIVRTDGSTGS